MRTRPPPIGGPRCRSGPPPGRSGRSARCRSLPEPEGPGVGLAGLQGARVGLGVEHQDRHVEVVPDQGGRRRRHRGQRRLRQGRTRDVAAVHQEAVIDVHERVRRVDVGDEAPGRLRLADGEQTIGAQPTQHRRGLVTDRLTRLREHVVGVAVTRVGQRRVPHRIPELSPLQRVEPHRLCRHADPGIALPDQLVVHVDPVGRRVRAPRHVQPLDHDGAVEVTAPDRPVHDDPRRVGSL